MTREEELEGLIVKYKKAYYDGEPLISDDAYDLLEDELRKLNPNNSALFLVGTPVGGKVQHDPPMLSCKKATDIADVVKWFNDSSGNDLYFGYKIDGLSLSVIYDDGKLIQAATRGNGQAGDDVTFAIYYIDNIPKNIPDKGRINVRGEVYMPISEFKRLKKEFPDYSSPRNLATGTIKQKDLSILKERKLKLSAWWLDGMGEMDLDKQMELIRTWGFETADIKKLTDANPEVIENAFNEVSDTRDKLDFELDGVMYKYNDAKDRELAGSTEHHPKWQIAMKFKSKGAITKINGITWQVGRTGVLTPVGEVEAVDVAGATIRRSTLHNAEFLQNLDAAIGDEVYIERSGDVIPKIIEVVKKGENHVTLPTNCPSCNSDLSTVGVNLVCTGITCKDRDLRNIDYWVDVTEIKGLGPKSIEALFDKGYVTHYSDLYADDLTEEKLVEVLGKNGEKVYENINKTRELDFHVFLAALGIQQLGKAMGKELAANFETLKQLQEASVEDLVRIEGISDLTAGYILEGINDENIVDRILMHDFKIKYSKVQKRDPSESKGKIYVTGKVEGYTKNEIQEKVEGMGFIWSKSVSRNLKHLVGGDNPGTSKINKALDLDIEVLTWNEFLEKYS